MGTFATPPPLLGDEGGPQFANYGDTGFGPIGGYPPAPDLGAPTLPTVTEATNNGVTFENPLLNSLATGINNGISSAKGLATGGTVLQWIEAHVEDLVFIILGLLLIAAGIFSFRSTQTIIREGGRAAATAAAAAA